jgi:hypothetical protein
MRYFRVFADDATYDGVRLSLDAAWGLPNDKGTATCLQPAASAARDGDGRILLAMQPEFVAYDAVAAVLPDLLASGAVAEITKAEYFASLPAE